MKNRMVNQKVHEIEKLSEKWTISRCTNFQLDPAAVFLANCALHTSIRAFHEELLLMGRLERAFFLLTNTSVGLNNSSLSTIHVQEERRGAKRPILS